MSANDNYSVETVRKWRDWMKSNPDHPERFKVAAQLQKAEQHLKMVSRLRMKIVGEEKLQINSQAIIRKGTNMTREEAIAEVFGITVEELNEALLEESQEMESTDTPFDRIIESAVDGNPVALEAVFADVMLDKIRQIVNDRKTIAAANLFGYEPQEEEVGNEQEDGIEVSDFDFDDEFAELFGDTSEDSVES
jgi:PAS domain-containing protein